MGLILNAARAAAQDDVLSVRDVGRLLGQALEDGKVSYTERKDLEQLTTEFSNEISPAARGAIQRFLAMGQVFDGNTAGKVFGLDVDKADKLEKAGVRTVKDLMITSKTPEGRNKLAAESALNLALVTDFAERADLARVIGVGNKYAAVLHGVSMNNIGELGDKDPAKLFDQIKAFMKTDAGKAITTRRPSMEKVEGWVQRAKELPELIKYVGDQGANFGKPAFDKLDNFKKFLLLTGHDVRLSDVNIFEAKGLKVNVPRRKPRVVTEAIQNLERSNFDGNYDTCSLTNIERIKADDDTLGFRATFDVTTMEQEEYEGQPYGDEYRSEGWVTVALDTEGNILGKDWDLWPDGNYEG